MENESERQEVEANSFGEKKLAFQRMIMGLELEIENKLELAQTHKKSMDSLAVEIDEMTIEFVEMTKLHAGWTALKYLAENDVRNLRSQIAEIEKQRDIFIGSKFDGIRGKNRFG